MSTAEIGVLVADDSTTMRQTVSALLREHAGIRVVGMAADGEEAVELAKRLRPTVITMDVMMPRLDGLTAIAEVMASAPTRILVVSSAAQEEVSDLSMRALAAGALEVIPKPAPKTADDLRSWGSRLAKSIRLMAEVPVITRHARPGVRTAPPPWGAGAVDAFGLVASTGGPQALVEILGALGPGLPVPVLIAQHMAEGFTPGLVRWLASVCPLPVELAAEGAPCLPGHVYLPPDGHDLEVDAGGVLRVRRSQGGACPSGDKLLMSMARVWANRAGGAVLTGMGEDGARGLLAIRRAGGVTVCQDEATSVVFGMPAAARRIGEAQCVVPLEGMAALVRELACAPQRRQDPDGSRADLPGTRREP